MKASIHIQPEGFPFNSAMAVKLPQGDKGVAYTVQAMRALAHDAQDSPLVQRAAATLKQRADADHVCPCRTLYDWLRRHFGFHRDPNHVELLRPPEQILTTMMRNPAQYAEGDCDELATLAVALLRAMGKPPALIIMSSGKKRPYHHVFYGMFDHRAHGLIDGVVPFDPQEKVPPGEWPPGARFKVFPV